MPPPAPLPPLCSAWIGSQIPLPAVLRAADAALRPCAVPPAVPGQQWPAAGTSEPPELTLLGWHCQMPGLTDLWKGLLG